MNTLVAQMDLGDYETSFVPDQLGVIRQHEARDYLNAEYVKPLLFGGLITAQLVVNRHSSALQRGQIVLHNTDAEGPGRAVEGPTSGAAIAAGVVPWCVPASGVPVGAAFWLIKSGFAKVISDGGADVAAGEPIQSAGSGKASKHTAGTNDIYACGLMIEDIGNADGVLKKALVNFSY